MAEVSNNIIAVLIGFLAVTFLLSSWVVLNKVVEIRASQTAAFGAAASGTVEAGVEQLVSVSMVISVINFSTAFNVTEIKDSHTDAAPGQRFFTVKNDGTLSINVSACSTGLWTGDSRQASDYNITVEDNETGAVGEFSLGSEGAWAIMNTTAETCGGADSGPGTKIAGFLNYSDANDEMNIFVKVHVPSDEPPGHKSSTVTLTAEGA